MKTRADFFKDCKTKHLALETIVNNAWKEGLPDRLKGIREITKVKSNAICLSTVMKDGTVRDSQLDLPRANLIDYDGETLSIYKSGKRVPNTVEQQALDDWEKETQTAEYKRDAEMDCYTDTYLTFYSKQTFFYKRGLSYLCGFEREKGMKLDINHHPSKPEDPKYLIDDENVRGELFFKYKIHDLDLEKAKDEVAKTEDEVEL